MRFSALVAVLLLVIPVALTGTACAQHHFAGYGGSLGPNWDGFPDRLVPDLVSSGNYEKLDVTLPVYLVYQQDLSTGCPVPVPNGPRRITEMEWWTQSQVENIASRFHVFIEYGHPFDSEYHPCPSGAGLDAPDFGPGWLNSDGTISIQDFKAGGIGSRTRILLRGCIDDTIPDPSHCYDLRVITLVWDHPGTYDEVIGCNNQTGQAVTQPKNARPGEIVLVEEPVEDETSQLHLVWTPQMTVEWVSTDIAGTSPRYMDAADLALFFSSICYGKPVYWGFPGDPQVRNFPCNVAPFGNLSDPWSTANRIDPSDLAALAADIGKYCGMSKPGTGEPVADILAWFGLATTGRTVSVGPNDEVAPEYVIVDPEQNRRAVADPFGYRTTVASERAERKSWSLMKRLYR